MLEYCRVSFRLELISLLHSGDGGQVAIGALKKDHPDLEVYNKGQKDGSGSEGLVQTVQRGVDCVPCIEGSSLRGALRALEMEFEENNAEELFGPEEIREDNQDEAKMGSLWFHGGLMVPNSGPDPCELPFWDGWTCVLTGHRADLDLDTVEEGFLYMTEYCPPGTQFQFEAIFCGPFTAFGEVAQPLFAAMCHQDGFSIGGEVGYGAGRARLLAGSLQIVEYRYDAKARAFSESGHQFDDLKAQADEATTSTFVLVLQCDGPFFIQDPYARKKEGDPDMRELRLGEGRPVFTGKAFLQELRRRVARKEIEAWLEAQHFDYDGDVPVDDFDRQLTADQSPTSLTKTHRLFGVPGWGKTLRIVSVDIQMSGARHRAQGIQLDAFTQGPIDGALMDYDVPAGVTVTVRLRLDEARYEKACKSDLPADRAVLEAALKEFEQEGFGPKYGHATNAGYGWFAATMHDVRTESAVEQEARGRGAL